MSGWVSSASAHHAFAAEFDANKPVSFKGTISKMEWVNPHTWLHVNVKQPDGAVENWAVEAGTPNVLFRRGFTKDRCRPAPRSWWMGTSRRTVASRQRPDLTLPDGRKLFLGSLNRRTVRADARPRRPNRQRSLRPRFIISRRALRSHPRPYATGRYVFLAFFEQLGELSSVGIHESEIAYSLIESIHVWSMCLFFGLAVMFDLRLLGWTMTKVPVSEFSRRLLPWTIAGFVVMAISGTLLFYAIPVRSYQNIFFRFKMILLLLAGLNVWIFIAFERRQWMSTRCRPGRRGSRARFAVTVMASSLREE
jgi:hypothetical protein